MAEDIRRFKLAHPLRTIDADELGLEHRVHRVGETLEMPYARAMRLVSSGMVDGAEPGKPETWDRALQRVAPVEQAAPAGTPTAAAPAKPGKTTAGGN